MTGWTPTSRSAATSSTGSTPRVRCCPGRSPIPASCRKSRRRTALLSPYDRLVYDRARIAELFDYEYVLEMYKPRKARRWGYFALPILHGDRLVGKVDATADRKARVLRVDAIHEDVPFSKAISAGVRAQLADLAGWLGLAGVTVP